MAKISDMLNSLEIVRPFDNPLRLKVKEKNIFIAEAEDEFCAQLITQIPHLYKYLNLLVKSNGDPNLVEDAKEYLRMFEELRQQDFEESSLSK